MPAPKPRTLALVFSLSLQPLLYGADLVPGGERALTSPEASPVPGYLVCGASNGDEFILTWINQVDRSTAYATRVSLSEPLASHSFLLPLTGVPCVTAIDDSVIVVWKEGQTFYSARLVGESLTASVPLLTSTDRYEIEKVVANDSEALVILHDTFINRMCALIIGRDGQLLREVLDLGAPFSEEFAPRTIAAAADPLGFFVAMSSATWGVAEEKVRARRITREGVTADFMIAPENRLFELAIAFDGTNYLVATGTRLGESSSAGADAVIVSPDGSSVSEPFTALSGGRILQSAVGGAGDSLLFFASDRGTPGIEAVRIDHASRTAGPAVSVAQEYSIGLVAGDSAILAIENTSFIRGRLLDRNDGHPRSSGFVISNGTPVQYQPAVALGAAVDLVVWSEPYVGRIDRMHRVMASRVRRDGSVIDPVPFVLSREGIHSMRPAVVFNGEQFVVAWCERTLDSPDQGKLVVRRVRQDGTAIEPAPVVVSEHWSDTPAMAVSGSTILLVWSGRGTRLSTHGPALEILGARLRLNGSVLDSLPLLISRDPWDHHDADVVAGAGGFLVGWQTSMWFGHHSPRFTGTTAGFVSLGGTVHEPVVLEHLSHGAQASPPELAWNGEEFLAAWESWGDANAVRLTANGDVSSGRFVLPLDSVADATFFEGSWHVVGGTKLGYDVFARPASDVRGIFLDSGLRTEETFDIAVSKDPELDPVVASDGSRAVLVYRRIIDATPHNGASRIMFRLYENANVCCAPDQRSPRRRATSPR